MEDVTAIIDRNEAGATVSASRGRSEARQSTTAGRMLLVAGRRYGATMSTIEAAGLFCCSAERLQQERGKGTLPVEPLQLGRRLRWPTLLVARALGLPVQGAEAGSEGHE